MSTVVDKHADVTALVLEHLLQRLHETPVENEPFSHFYIEQVFPEGIYQQMMQALPHPEFYTPICLKKHSRPDGTSTRDVLTLDQKGLDQLAPEQHLLWNGVARALASPALKKLVFEKLSVDLCERFGVDCEKVAEIEAHARPTLFRDLEGYEIPPHPDGRKKVVTMQLYLPRDKRQMHLGTALYRRRFHSVRGLMSWKGRFERVKQFPFAPNSGYAFVVSNSLKKKSWHGRELVPDGSGVRNTLLNIYYRDQDASY